MRQKLNLVTLGVKDLKRSSAFYTDVLGWEPSKASQESIVFFDLGGVVLSLYPREALAEDVTMNSKGFGLEGITLAHNAKSEEDVNDIFSRIEGKGARIVKKPKKAFWGGYSGKAGSHNYLEI